MQAIGLLISAGTVNDIITKGNHIFHEEKKSLLKAGIENSSYITVDDTGMPHKGKNGYCTHIGNDLFAFYKSSDSKSRLNFLDILNQGKKTYCINGYAIDYLKLSKFPQEKITLFERTQGKKFSKIPESDSQVKEQKKIISQIWKFYKLLKFYKEFPCYRNKVRLENIFDRIFCQKVQWNALTERLKLIHKNKKGLLLVLGRPEIPLHTNQSENDLREMVKKRKVSAGTRSDDGRDSRDTFLSLNKTCFKLRISFWDYLLDRVNNTNAIKPLSQIIAQAAFNTS